MLYVLNKYELKKSLPNLVIIYNKYRNITTNWHTTNKAQLNWTQLDESCILTKCKQWRERQIKPATRLRNTRPKFTIHKQRNKFQRLYFRSVYSHIFSIVNGKRKRKDFSCVLVHWYSPFGYGYRKNKNLRTLLRQLSGVRVR